MGINIYNVFRGRTWNCKHCTFHANCSGIEPLCNSYIESAVVKYAQQAHKHYQYTQLPLLLLLVCV